MARFRHETLAIATKQNSQQRGRPWRAVRAWRLALVFLETGRGVYRDARIALLFSTDFPKHQ
jgi:hypothetical protein